METHYRFEVDMELAEVIDCNFEGFLDTLSERATGSPCLMELSYGVIEAKDEQTLRLWVSGDVSALIEDLDDDEAEKLLASLSAQPLAQLDVEPATLEAHPRSRLSDLSNRASTRALV